MPAFIVRGLLLPLLAGLLLQPGATAWTARTSGPGQHADFAWDVAISPDGARTFVTGFSDDALLHRDYLTVAYDSELGTPLWTRRYDGGNNGAAAVTVDPDGATVYVTGGNATLAYDAITGAQRWIQPFTGAQPWSGDEGFEIQAVSGAVFVTGMILSGMQTIAYDPGSGDELWRRVYGHNILPASMDVTADGSSVAITGAAISTQSLRDYVTVVYDAADGTQRWVRTYDGPVNLRDEATSVVTTGDAVIVTGESTGVGSLDALTIAYDLTTGVFLWSRRFDGPAHGAEAMPSLALAADGSLVFAVTRSADATGRFDYVTLAYDPTTGARSWARRVVAGIGAYLYFPPSLVASPYGTNVLITGRTNDDEYLTVAYGTDGSRLWTRRFARWGTNSPSAIAISADGRITVVTGTSWGTVGSDFATVAYLVHGSA